MSHFQHGIVDVVVEGSEDSKTLNIVSDIVYVRIVHSIYLTLCGGIREHSDIRRKLFAPRLTVQAHTLLTSLSLVLQLNGKATVQVSSSKTTIHDCPDDKLRTILKDIVFRQLIQL